MADTGMCECGHNAAEHDRRRCTALDSYGIRCECDEFIEDRSVEDDEPDDANEFIQPRSVAQLEEVLHAQDIAHFYAPRES